MADQPQPGMPGPQIHGAVPPPGMFPGGMYPQDGMVPGAIPPPGMFGPPTVGGVPVMPGHYQGGYPMNVTGIYAYPQIPTMMNSDDKPTLHKFEPFDASGDAATLRKAMKGMGTDEDAIIGLLTKRTSDQRAKILKKYNTVYNDRDCIKDIGDELHGKLERAVIALMTPLPLYLAQELHHAMDGPGTKERTLIEILCSLNNQWIFAIKNAYYKEYEKHLVDDIKDDTSGEFRKLLISMCDGKRDEKNNDPALASNIAQQLHTAGEGKFGTDESEFRRVMTSYSYPLLKAVFEEYKNIEGKEISDAIDSELSGEFKEGVMAIYEIVMNRPAFFARELHDCMSGLGTRDGTLIRLVLVRSEIDMQNIKEEYLKLYDKTLVDKIKGDTSGDYEKLFLAMVEG
ncbi:unnamed protein product [Meganyctiphanes norvegica]|uniref:Annexin n=1 Tax=Meganyctiphanes norvegica TaxID=48144 RepID=A0AAV2PYD1_MEGNR